MKINLAKIRLPGFFAKQKKELLSSGLIMLAICASCALVLSGLSSLLSPQIEKNATAALMSAMQRVLPADEYVNTGFENKEEDKVVSVYEARSGETLLGYCVEATADDYGEEMRVCVAVDTEDKVIAVEIISISGKDSTVSKVKDSSFLSQFVGKSGNITAVRGIAKADTQVSEVSEASASSKAVAECVNRAVAAVSQIEAEKAKEAAGL